LGEVLTKMTNTLVDLSLDGVEGGDFAGEFHDDPFGGHAEDSSKQKVRAQNTITDSFSRWTKLIRR
jgi:hypothetical protein